MPLLFYLIPGGIGLAYAAKKMYESTKNVVITGAVIAAGAGLLYLVLKRK